MLLKICSPSPLPPNLPSQFLGRRKAKSLVNCLENRVLIFVVYGERAGPGKVVK
jgi:hypothetical protein